MRIGEDIGVHPQGEAGADTQRLGPRGEQVQLSLGLHVEEQNVRLQRRIELPDLLADTGEHHPLQGGLMRLADTLQLPAGDDVEARTLLPQ